MRFVGVNVCAADAHQLGAAPAGRRRARRARGARRRARAAGARPRRTATEVRAQAERWERARRGRPRAAARRAHDARARRCGRSTGRARAGDWVVAAAGSPPGDLLKLWRCPQGGFAHLEFALLVHGPRAAGRRSGSGWREPDAGEIFVVIGDGTYLMAPTELVTAAAGGPQGDRRRARQRRLPLDRRRSSARTLGDGLRQRVPPSAVDYAANAREPRLRDVGRRRRSARSTPRSRPRAASRRPGAWSPATSSRAGRCSARGAWWDLGVPGRPARERARSPLAAAHARGRGAAALPRMSGRPRPTRVRRVRARSTTPSRRSTTHDAWARDARGARARRRPARAAAARRRRAAPARASSRSSSAATRSPRATSRRAMLALAADAGAAGARASRCTTCATLPRLGEFDLVSCIDDAVNYLLDAGGAGRGVRRLPPQPRARRGGALRRQHAAARTAAFFADLSVVPARGPGARVGRRGPPPDLPAGGFAEATPGGARGRAATARGRAPRTATASATIPSRRSARALAGGRPRGCAGVLRHAPRRLGHRGLRRAGELEGGLRRARLRPTARATASPA